MTEEQERCLDNYANAVLDLRNAFSVGDRHVEIVLSVDGSLLVRLSIPGLDAIELARRPLRKPESKSK